MEYTFRDLKSSDMGAVCKILTSIGVKEFKNIDIAIGKDATPTEIGTAVIFGIAGIVIENIPKAQKDIDIFLASVTGLNVEEIKDMSLSDYGDLIVQVIKKDEFKDFFVHVMKLFNR